MSYQAYLDTVKAQTGKTVGDFRELAEAKGMDKHGEIVKWLKGEFGLGHGHATAVAGALLRPDAFKTPKAEKVDAVFSGKKAVWKDTYESLLEAVKGLGQDIDIAPTDSYVSLRRGGRKFAIVQPTSERLDIGIKRKGVDATERFEAAGNWNSMVTHRVRITEPAQVDAEVLEWLKAAYEGGT